MKNSRVFVSSTFTDLKDFREAVRNAIRQLGAVDISMEHFGARDERPKEECLRLIKDESDAFVGIYAHWYGHVPVGDEISITEAEYLAAKMSEIPKLIYLVDEEMAWKPAHIAKGEPEIKLRALKDKLRANHICATFTNRDDLAKNVVADLGRYFSEEEPGAETEAKNRSGRSSLPPQPHFFGREEELAKIKDALVPEARSWGVLIDGPGGIGKTALAIRAAQLAPPEHYPLKIFLSAKVRELTAAGEQPLQDFMLPNFIALISELAAELGLENIARTPPDDRANIVRRELAGKQALIIIDNLETFVEKERVRLYQFLSRLPDGCKAIVTSRRRTDIDARVIRLDRLALKDALDLIAELATSNRHLARASEKERHDLYEITGGNPLLIKWVAGQLGREGSQCRTIAEACRYIESAPKGNDPLEYIFGDLLDTFTDSETAVLAALTHFTQPAKVKWIVDLSGLADRVAETALEDLTDRALLVSDETSQTFLLPPLAAIFLRRKRPEAVARAGNRLIDSVYALALENGYDNFEQFPKLETEWSAIAAALPLFLQGDNDHLQKLCSAVYYFLEFSGRWDELASLYQKAEERAVATEDFESAGWRACEMGWTYYLCRQGQEVLICADNCEMHWQKVSVETRQKTVVSHLRGLGYELEKKYPEAIAAFREALALHRTIAAESSEVAIYLNCIANIELASGNYDSAEHNFREALRIAEKLNYRLGIATYTSNLALVALNQEDFHTTESLAREALALAENIGRLEVIGLNCYMLAKALARQGRRQEGLAYARRAIEIFTKVRSEDLEEAQATLKLCEDEA
jgi:tetratricopeptide (TPR) repeat protein